MSPINILHNAIVAFAAVLALSASSMAYAQSDALSALDQRLEPFTTLRPITPPSVPGVTSSALQGFRQNSNNAFSTPSEGEAQLFARTKPTAAPATPFSVSAQGGFELTNNAFRSNQNRHSDGHFTPGVNVGYVRDAIFDSSVKFAASATVDTDRYLKHTSLNSDSVSAKFALSNPLGPFMGSIAYNPKLAFQPDFEKRTLTLHLLSASIERSYGVNFPEGISATIAPNFTIARAQADPSDFDKTQGTLTATYRTYLSREQAVLLEVAPTIAEAYYEDYFGDPRNDVLLSAAAAIAWNPVDWVLIRASASFIQNYSSRDKNEYTRAGFIPAITLTARF